MGGPVRILIVEDDDAVALMLVDHLQHLFDAEVTRMASAVETFDSDDDRPYDAMLISQNLSDGDGLDVLRVLAPERSVAVMLMADHTTAGRTVEAMRLGVRDVFIKPFDLSRLTSVLETELTANRKQRRLGERIRRQQRLIKRILDDRRTLQERVDLVCRDLVQAYRHLAEKVTADPGTL